MLRSLFGFVLSVAVSTVAASFAHAYMSIRSLQDMGVNVAITKQVDIALQDLAGLAPTYGVVIGIGFFIAFLVGWRIRLALRAPRWVAYGAAGAVAIAVALMAMEYAYGGITPLAGARTNLGFALQVAAGVLGGLVFTWVTARPTH